MPGSGPSMQGAQIMELCAVAQACLALADRIDRVYGPDSGTSVPARNAARWHSMATWALEYVEQRYHDAADKLEDAVEESNERVRRGLREGQPVTVRVARPPHRSARRVAPAPPVFVAGERGEPVVLGDEQRAAMSGVLERIGEDAF